MSSDYNNRPRYQESDLSDYDMQSEKSHGSVRGSDRGGRGNDRGGRGRGKTYDKPSRKEL